MSGTQSFQLFQLVGGILVGGESRRMGRDKALIDVGGETLLERTLRVATSCARECVLVGEAPFELPSALRDVRRVPDGPDGAGPIAGLSGLMSAYPDSAVLLLACDMPRLGPDLLERLAYEAGLDDAGAGSAADAIVPETLDREGVRRHPCCAIYRPTARRRLAAAIEAGQFGMTAMLGRMNVRFVKLPGGLSDQLLNWNTPLDLLGGRPTEPG